MLQQGRLLDQLRKVLLLNDAELAMTAIDQPAMGPL